MQRGHKIYEFSGHTGNVHLTTTDRTIPVDDGDGEIYTFLPDVNSTADYYPFGMLKPGRNTGADSYRYAFQGQESDPEITGYSNISSAQNWKYDQRLGRRWDPDPIVKPFESPYSTLADNPIIYVDFGGDDWFYYQAKGDKTAAWHWHEGSTHTIVTGVNMFGQITEKTLRGQKAVVVFDGSRNEKPGANGIIDASGAVSAKVTVYVPNNEIKRFTGFTMTSRFNKDDPSKGTIPIAEGVYNMRRRDYGGKKGTIIPKHYQLWVPGTEKDALGPIPTMDKLKNTTGDIGQDPYTKTAIFVHATGKNGWCSGGVSTGCLLIQDSQWGTFDAFLKQLGDGVDIMVVLSRTGSSKNPNLTAPMEVELTQEQLKFVESANQLGQMLNDFGNFLWRSINRAIEHTQQGYEKSQNKDKKTNTDYNSNHGKNK